VRHVADGSLRRLGDEPPAVPDRVVHHVAGCARCTERQARIAADAELLARAFSGPRPAPDVDRAWDRLRMSLDRQDTPAAVEVPRLHRVRRVPLRTTILAGAVGLVVAGTAAAATLTTVFAPTHVVALSLPRSDLQDVAAVMGVGGGGGLGGFPSPSGSRTLPFGTVSWQSSGPPRTVPSLGEAVRAAGFRLILPARLPVGVGATEEISVQPQVRVTVRFDPGEPSVGGSRVDLQLGPAVLVEYGSAGGGNLPTLAVLTTPRPTALSSGASTSQIESFLLARPGLPEPLVEEIKLLGDLSTTLPVPVPPGASARSVTIDGAPGVLVADQTNAAAGVVWEDQRGIVHLVAGLVDTRDLLEVADQLG